MRNLIFYFASLFFVLMPNEGYPNEISFDLALGIGKLDGDSTYKTGYSSLRPPKDQSELNGFPISKLEFPLDVYLIAGKGVINYKRLKVRVDARKSISSDAGHMEDEDWLYPSDYPRYLNSYSKNDANLDALILNGNFRVKAFNISNLAVFGGLGFLYQNFDFETTNEKSKACDAKDKDHHLQRNPQRLSKGNCDGDAYLYSIGFAF